MKKAVFFIFIIFLSSCLKEELNIDKFDNLVLRPDILLPFAQIELSNKYYDSIQDDTGKDSIQNEMIVELFKNNNVSDYIDKMEFYFKSFNGFPIDFDNLDFHFLDSNKVIINTIPLGNIVKAELNSDGSLKTATPTLHKTTIFVQSDIEQLMNTRYIRVNLSWKGNPLPLPAPHDSYIFNTNSYVILRTKFN
jgi:hypothetical protein